jgi:UDP-glucuronate 4-epimerase
MRVLVTGAAGFIGMHLCERLLHAGLDVAGLDAVTPYYDPALKQARLERLKAFPGFVNHRVMLEDRRALDGLLRDFRPEIVVHLAAQPGVRYSIEEPAGYISSNIVGSFNLLEAIRAHSVDHLLMASTSSVYGAGAPPFRETDRTDHPLSLYAATKKAAEDLAHSYAHLYGIRTTMMRFFTVYGPWSRPDMAMFKFARDILAGEPIDVYNASQAMRDFTHVLDVVEAIELLMSRIPEPGLDSGASPSAPYRVVNIAGGRPIALNAYISALEEAIGRPAIRRELPAQPGEMTATAADVTLLRQLTGFTPTTPIETGVRQFVDWYRSYHGV